MTEEDLHFRFLKTVNNWPATELEQLYTQLEQDAGNTTVTSMIPFIRQMYRILLSVFFLGEHRVIDILKTVVKDMSAYPDIPKNKVNYLITDLTDEWYYIYNKVTKGLYPLLLRVCSSSYIDYHLFLTQHTGKIFHFLGITKYDILLPAKKKGLSPLLTYTIPATTPVKSLTILEKQHNRTTSTFTSKVPFSPVRKPCRKWPLSSL